MKKYKYSFKDAISVGIDYRDYEKVSELPKNETYTAVAGVWGDYYDIRCLFVSSSTKQYCRKGFSNNKYLIKELGISGNLIEVGQKFEI